MYAKGIKQGSVPFAYVASLTEKTGKAKLTRHHGCTLENQDSSVPYNGAGRCIVTMAVASTRHQVAAKRGQRREKGLGIIFNPYHRHRCWRVLDYGSNYGQRIRRAKDVVK